MRIRQFLAGAATAIIVIAPLAHPTAAAAQTSNPDSARIITRDVSNFWHAVDAAPVTDTTALVASIRDLYLRNPDPGLFDWITNRLVDQDAFNRTMEAKGLRREQVLAAMRSPAGTPERATFDTVIMPALLDNASRALAETYLVRRKYYDAIRANTLAVDTSRAIKDSIHAAFRRLSAVYPDARYGDVYFLIGRMTSGGTTGKTELLIGTEMFGRDPSTPIDELPAWHRAVTGQIADLPQIVAHEMIHTLQGQRSGRQTLLAAALNEGSADFLAELVSGKHIINPAYAFGDAHEHELWTEFSAAMDGSKTDAWLYQGDRAPPGRPADLGYWMGYEISKAYYDRASDKRAAVREILLFRDPKAFLAASGYGR